MFNAGDLFSIYCSSLNPAKHKYVVCVSPLPLFFYINSKYSITKQGVDVLISQHEAQFLKHDSYICTSLLLKFHQHELNQAQHLGTLPGSIQKQIKSTVANHSYLPEIQKQIVLNNFK